MDSEELERLKYEARGVRLYRHKKIKLPCHELTGSWREWRYVGDAMWQENL